MQKYYLSNLFFELKKHQHFNTIGKIVLKLENPKQKFKELSNDNNFFEIYKQEQNSLKDLEKKWSDQTEELERIL